MHLKTRKIKEVWLFMNYLVLTQFLCFRLVTLPTAKFKLCLVKISSVCWKQRYVSKLLNISNITVFNTNKVFQKTAKRSLFGRTSRCWISCPIQIFSQIFSQIAKWRENEETKSPQSNTSPFLCFQVKFLVPLF